MINFKILNRWSGEVQFTAEIDCAEDALPSIKLGLAVKWAVKNGASLVRANLDGANLVRANLDGANLDGASLVRANLVRANLDGASLDGANLDGANLVRANLVRANLDGASLVRANLVRANLDGASLDGANLDGANLVRANLVRANLNGANLNGANLNGANLVNIRNDLWDVLLRAPAEVSGLLAALREGRVNGRVYEGECACLVGTIANIRHADHTKLGHGLNPDSDRPIERWFFGIATGDTPETNPVAKITEGWIVEFLALTAPAPMSQHEPA